MSKEEAMKNNMTLYNPETGYSDGTDGSLTEGNLYLFNDPLKEGKGWLDKYYLYQVPTTEILLNPRTGTESWLVIYSVIRMRLSQMRNNVWRRSCLVLNLEKSK